MAKKKLGTGSLRQQAFLLYDFGYRPANLRFFIEIRDDTAYRYFQQWKKSARWIAIKYKNARRSFRSLNRDEKRIIGQVLADELGCPVEKVLELMRKPWSLKHIITGKWRHWPVKRKAGTSKTPFPNKLITRLQLAFCRKQAGQIIAMALNPLLAPDLNSQ